MGVTKSFFEKTPRHLAPLSGSPELCHEPAGFEVFCSLLVRRQRLLQSAALQRGEAAAQRAAARGLACRKLLFMDSPDRPVPGCCNGTLSAVCMNVQARWREVQV